MLRKARLDDADVIKSLIDFYAKEDLMIPRSLNEIYENIRDFWVYQENDTIVGCCALHVFGWEGLAEIKSFAVDQAHHKKGIGKELISCCFKDATELRIKKIFVLTYVPEFFEKFGFSRVDKSMFPQKIWAECCNCPKFPDCKEIALIKKL